MTDPSKPGLGDRVDALLRRWDDWTNAYLESAHETRTADATTPRVQPREMWTTGYPASTRGTQTPEAPMYSGLTVEPQAWWPEQRWSFGFFLRLVPLFMVGTLVLWALGYLLPTFDWWPVSYVVRAAFSCAIIVLALVPIWPDFVRFTGLADPRRAVRKGSLTRALLMGVFMLLVAWWGMGVLVAKQSMGEGFPDELAGPPVRAAWFVVTIILAVIRDELMFRGFLLGAFVSRWSPRRSIFVSAILFALVRLTPKILGAVSDHATDGFSVAALVATIPFLWLIGSVLGWYQLRFGSLYGCIFIHTAIGLVAVAITLL